jgi:hypothetical protein
MTSINQPPQTVGQLSGKASGTMLQRSWNWANALPQRQAGFCFMVGNIALLAQGVVQAPLEIVSAGLSTSNATALIFWPESKKSIRYLGATVIAGCGLMIISAQDKTSPWPQTIFGGMGMVRGAFLLLPEPKAVQSAAFHFCCKHKNKSFGLIGVPSRAFLFVGGILNKAPGTITASLAWFAADMIIAFSKRKQMQR